jgi:hypothetical protein
VLAQLDDAMATVILHVPRDLRAGVANHDVPVLDNHFDSPADVLVRHGVSIGIDIDQAIRGDLARARQRCGRDELERQQCRRFRRKAVDRPLVRGAVDPHVGDLSHPLLEVGLQSLERSEAHARERVALDVLHATLDLPLRPRAEGSARFRHRAVQAAEGQERFGKAHAVLYRM